MDGIVRCKEKIYWSNINKNLMEGGDRNQTRQRDEAGSTLHDNDDFVVYYLFACHPGFASNVLRRVDDYW